ncbi:flagellar biogenesis protein [Novosphingobium sp. FSY-8]|uniref:Flagellar biogenesis protein n=1 Tax=Novosphingobium ovatum TaxID=1908523 RepID=A0ABW9XG64_9SPHN|nr:flagellar biosynthetic protein FliO [Novosphingobium ovatum]NBC37518.1 flagellar biogenesis protein [Novosphingobium ovatum]
MLWYIIKLVVLLPLIGGLIWGSLKLSKHLQGRFMGQGATRSVRIVETVMLSPTLKLAVLEFHGREILVSTGRNGLTRLAEAPARPREPEVPATDPAARTSFLQTLKAMQK